jgi:type VI secretion system secreted protein VgrG
MAASRTSPWNGFPTTATASCSSALARIPERNSLKRYISAAHYYPMEEAQDLAARTARSNISNDSPCGKKIYTVNSWRTKNDNPCSCFVTTTNTRQGQLGLSLNRQPLGALIMPNYTQADRPLKITTPLGEDLLLLARLRGHESISQLFDFQLDLLAEAGSEIHFEKILGQKVTVEMRLLDGKKRYFNGLVKRFSQGARDERFVRYRAEIVPKIWLLTKKVRSRIFQHLTVPEIIRHMLSAFDVDYEIYGTYYQRDYCVQYRESDFDFVSRLMEEEGIYYFFNHSHDTHQLKVTDVPNQHPSVEGQTNVIYDELSGGERDDMRITVWEKTQELRSGEYTLWDHCFELTGKNLQVKEKTIESVAVGKVTHKLSVGGNDQLEIYDYPGGYAQRFDGVDPSGGARPQDLKDVFRDSERTTRVRMEQEEALTLAIEGASNCGNFMAGHKFTLERHFNADGPYLLTRVEHDAQLGSNYQSGEPLKFDYQNHFSCLPFALAYRPQRVTPRPVISGNQTATVVGPKGEEIFCDKYGRVKVQFHWDREGKKDDSSSCWIRVAQVWAGKGWGAFFWPRIGHEVVVLFEEGDPDQPLIVGSVYNAENMPWFSLPINKSLAGFKSESIGGTPSQNYNGIVFNDREGVEHVAIHSQRNLALNSEGDKMMHAGVHKGERVAVGNILTVGKLIPGGGSGGGDFDEGNPMPDPAPTGIFGLNSVVTYGENLQVACPLNHQLAVGNNIQLCINPFGLAAGAKGAPVPGIISALLGGGMGGNMQFTMGTSAQFTLGQSFEISIGPPKIEIHQGYNKHEPVQGLCGILGAVAIAFVIAYDIVAVKQHYTTPQQSWTDQQVATEKGQEQNGDKTRAALALAFQLAANALLTAIMGAEALLDKADWFTHDALKELFETQIKFKTWQPPDTNPTTFWESLAFGCIGTVGTIAAEVALDSQKM